MSRRIFTSFAGISISLCMNNIGAVYLPNEEWTQEAYFGSKGIFFADVDGDGKADAIVVNDDRIVVRRSNGSRFLPNEEWTQEAYFGSKGIFFADVDGDGKADAIIVNDDRIVVRRSNGSRFLPNEEWTQEAYFGSKGIFFADVDGDGKADAIVVNDDRIVVRRSNGSRFLPNEEWTQEAYFGSKGIFFADVDGDGKADAIVVNDDRIVVRRSNGSRFLPNEEWTQEAYFGSKGIFFADVDGDGKADAIVVNDDRIVVRRSNGSRFLPNEVWTQEAYFGSKGLVFVDVNGDRKADAIVVNDDKVVARRADPAASFSPLEVIEVSLEPGKGFADLHNHTFANLGFGGKAFVGGAFGLIQEQLPHCDYWKGDPLNWVHGPGGVRDNFGALLGVAGGTQGLPGAGHLVGGYPEFDGWPRWNSFTHQSVFQDWLYRAYKGGLRLMVMLAVNNEWVCEKIERAPGRTCSDMEAVDLQLAAAKQMESYIDSTSGGLGTGWYRIVTSSADAAKVIADGKLAVVLGIEVDYLFNCKSAGSCSVDDVVRELDKYYAMGVRHVFPIHFSNNGFGGTAFSNGLMWDPNLGSNLGVNPLTTLHAYEVNTRDCSGEGYQYRTGRCNAVGLTDLGKELVSRMIRKGLIIDVDHMSALSFSDTLDIAEQLGYPVVSGHTGFTEISTADKSNEGNRNPGEIERIRNVGGMLAIIPHQGSLGQIKTWRGSGSTVVEHTCGNSSETWAQAYLYAVEKMRGRAVAFGTDFNGLAGLPGPRFGPEQCPGGQSFNIGPTNIVTYPFTIKATGVSIAMDRSQVGQKNFNINEDGLAHVGMLPDFIADLEHLGLQTKDIDPLFDSASEYVRLWGHSEAVAKSLAHE